MLTVDLRWLEKLKHAPLMVFHTLSIIIYLTTGNTNQQKTSNTLPETNITPENGWLEDEFPLGKAYFQRRFVSLGRVSQILSFLPSRSSASLLGELGEHIALGPIVSNSQISVYIGCGPLTVTVVNEGLGWDSLLKM